MASASVSLGSPPVSVSAAAACDLLVPSIPTSEYAAELKRLYSFQLYDDIRYITICFKTKEQKLEWFRCIQAAQKDQKVHGV